MVFYFNMDSILFAVAVALLMLFCYWCLCHSCSYYKFLAAAAIIHDVVCFFAATVS